MRVHEKKIRVEQKIHLVHEKKDQGGKKLQNSDPVLLIDTTEYSIKFDFLFYYNRLT